MSPEEFNYSTDITPKYKNIRLHFIEDTFQHGMITGAAVTVAIFGISQQLYSHYWQLVDNIDFLHKIGSIWFGIKWQIWFLFLIIILLYNYRTYLKIKNKYK